MFKIKNPDGTYKVDYYIISTTNAEGDPDGFVCGGTRPFTCNEQTKQTIILGWGCVWEEIAPLKLVS